MKILFIVPALGPIYGGPSKSVVELAGAIGHQGHLVDLVATNANGAQDLSALLNQWQLKASYRARYFSRWKVTGEYKVSASLTRWLFQNIKNYDIVHTHSLFCYPTLPAYWTCRFHRIPYLMSPRGMLEPWALSYKSGKKRLYYRLLEKPAINRASALHLLASTETEHVKALNLHTPLVTIPNGIHRQDFETLPSPELFYRQFPDTRHKTLLLFLGRIDPKKGLDLLAPAFAQVRQQLPNTHLVVAGPDNIGFLPTVKNFFAEAGCLEDVTFTGMLTGQMKYAALSAAEIYVAPSYSEGFSMSVLEGMASGLPCVITTGCNFPEAGAAGAAHVVPPTVDAIAGAMQDCLSDLPAAEAMGQRARQFVFDNYSWSVVAQQMASVYRWVLGQQAKPDWVYRVSD